MRIQKTVVRFIWLLILITQVGCKSEDPSPELKDPIYGELIKEQKSAEDQVKKSSDAIKALEKTYAEQEVRSIDKKSTQKELLAEQEKFRRATQEAEFYRIAALKRKAEAQISYKKAFAAGEPWPDPKEYENFKNMKRLRSVSRNWNERVPKIQNPLNSAEPEKK